VVDGWLLQRSAPSHREPVSAAVARRGTHITAEASAEQGDEKKRYSMHSFGAVFVEVHIDPDLGTVRMPRVVAAYGIGRILNRKTAHSQLMGGIVWGLGMGLMGKTEMDWRYGRAVNANLADHHVPVNSDIGAIDITILDEDDKQINELGEGDRRDRHHRRGGGYCERRLARDRQADTRLAAYAGQADRDISP
jgi:xanthine dehydrogenase YagR molybdenum-binding subunit